MPGSKDRLRWFNERRFGMFIHWGLYSIPAIRILRDHEAFLGIP
jgi:hypothetical protein